MGARLNDSADRGDSVEVESFTACLRFNIKILGTVENGKRGQIMSMVADIKSTALPDFRNLLDLWAIYPASILAFGHPQTNTTYSTYILQDSQAYRYEDVNKVSNESINSIPGIRHFPAGHVASLLRVVQHEDEEDSIRPGKIPVVT